MRKLLHKPWRQQAHVSGKANKINFVVLQSGDYFAVMLLARLALGRDDKRFQPTLAGRRNARCIWLVGDDNGDPRIGNAAGVDVIGDGDEIRTASGKEDAQGFHARLSFR